MKTIVIFLDAHDDLISVRDKMVWSKAQRILLVWPEERSPHLERKYDLVSLQRQATSLGAQLGLVTRDREVVANARELGVATFRSEKQAQRSRWQHTRVQRRFYRREMDAERVKMLREGSGAPPPPAFRLGWTRLAVFSAGVLAVLVMSIFLLPGAVVKIQPVQQDQSLSMTLAADPNLTRASLSGIVPAEEVSTIVEIQGQIPTSGKASIPDEKAGGVVAFTNLTDHNLDLPAGSVVSTLKPDELRYETQRSIQVPAGETVSVEVLALTGGSAGNVNAGAVKALEGPLGPDVVVSNTEAFGGGSDASVPAVAQADYDRLYNQLLAELKNNAQTDLEFSLGSQKDLIPDTLTMEKQIEETASPEVGSPGDTLTLNLRARFTALAVTSQDVQRVIEAALDANLPEGQLAVPGSLNIASETRMTQAQDGRIEWSVKVNRKTIVNLSRDTLLKAVLGKRPEEASRNLTAVLDLETPPQIQLTPAWWFWMPSLGFRIQFEVQ